MVVAVDIHQIERHAGQNSLFGDSDVQHLIIYILQRLLFLGQLTGSRTHQGIHAPIVEDGGATVVATEAFLVHTLFAILLTCIDHHRILLKEGRDHESGHALTATSGKERAGDALLVVILEEVEHVVADIIGLLPGSRNGMSGLAAANHLAHRVVHTHLIVEVIETGIQIITVLSRIIHLANENLIGIDVLHLICSPLPEGGRYHLGHIATEAIDTLLGPEQQDIRHLAPSVGDRIKMPYPTGIVVETIVQLHGFIPVVHARCIMEAIVSSSLGRLFQIRILFTMIEVEIRREPLSGTVVEIVLRTETKLRVILLTQILDALRLTDGMILTSHMVRHEIDDNLHAGLMSTLYQRLKLLHTLIDIDSQIGIDVVIISNGIGRTGLTFHHGGVVLGYAIGRIVGLSGMTDDTCVPNMAHAHLPDFLQGAGREVVHLSTSVLFNRPTLLAGGVPITIETSKNLIDNHFIRFHEQTLHG